MKYRAKPVSSRLDPSKVGVDIENEEFEKIKENTDEDGQVNLGEVYNIPAPTDSTGRTVVKLMEREGIEYTDAQYRKEYQLKATHQYMINGASTAQIAQALNVSLGEAKNLKRELAARQLNEIKNFDPQQEIAKAYMFYDHVAAKALQMANKTSEGTGTNKKAVSMRSQIEALKVALQAQSDKQKFLAIAGAYEQGLRSGDASNKHTNDANDTRDMFNAVLSGDVYEVVEEEDNLEDGIEIL
jgi:hypothetical protein